MIENYYTKEQLEYFRQRNEQAAAAGVDLAKQGQADWAALLDDVRAALEQGIDPADPRLRSLEERRRALVSAFSGGNPGIEQSLKRLWTEQGDKLCAQYGMDPKVMEYLGKISAEKPEKKP